MTVVTGTNALSEAKRHRTRASSAAAGVLVLLVTLALLIASPSARSNARAPALDPVRAWNELGLDAARTKRLSDAQAARLYAMVNVAVYDAINGIVSRQGKHSGRGHALVPPTGAPARGDLDAAAAAAAHAVLRGEFPDQAARYDAQLAEDLAALREKGRRRVSAGKEWGAAVGAAVRAARTNDGSTPNETQPAGSGPGVFRAAWSGVQFRNLAPFAIADPSTYVSSGPPELHSLEYAGAFAEVKLIGNAAIHDASKLATFQYWSLGTGSSQPPGAWIQVALAVTAARSLPLPETARLFALASMAMSDTVAPTVSTKFTYRRWRPATAIREADTDGNPFTDADPSWAPRAGGIGTSPEYWSGHSSFSGSAAASLAGFFCDDSIRFTLITDSAPGGQARTYPSFSAAAAEAGRSRVLGGIHFEFSNQDALASGRAVAAEILGNKLLRKRRPTHFGQCPR
jgi:PAP2 superfamily